MSRLTFLDTGPNCKAFETPLVAVETLDQFDHILQDIVTKHGLFDIIVDDAGQEMYQWKGSFSAWRAQLSYAGLYVVEDANRRYWPDFSGGFRAVENFIKFLKDVGELMHS